MWSAIILILQVRRSKTGEIKILIQRIQHGHGGERVKNKDYWF